MDVGLPGQPSGGNEPAKELPRLLLIMAEPALLQSVRQTLQRDRFDVRGAGTADEVTAVVQGWLPQLAIVDADLAEGTILQQLTSTVERAGRFPVVALTRRDDLQTRLEAFEWGVDDILSLPFSPEELLARVLVILRRHQTRAIALTEVLPAVDLEIDILRRKVKLHGAELDLTTQEQSVLYLLIANAGRTLTWEEILRFVWGADVVGDRALVDRVVGSLRAKLGDDWRHPRYIATVARTGYTFVQQARDHPAPPGVADPSP